MDNNVVISTRVRLARNLKSYPFPCRLNLKGREVVSQKVGDALKNGNSAIAKDFEYIDFDSMSDSMKLSFAERRLVSPDFITDTKGRALLMLKDGTVSLMLNEEDHIRLQIIMDGFCPDEAYDLADKIDTLLDERLTFAFDDKLGYLTQCPTNLGTGMRASVMLHLPALKQSGAMNTISANLSKLGIAVRGMYGEGSASNGAVYQLSNRVSLGISEKAALQNLKNITEQLVNREVMQRERLIRSVDARDRIMRSLGILRYALTISHKEAVALLSDVRLGICAGLIDIPVEKINSLMTEIQPATLTVNAGKAMKSAQRDVYRADYIRKALN